MSDEGTTPVWLRGSRQLTQAYELAREAHRDQSRKDGTSPYIGHPLAVTQRLAEAGLDEATLAAALLHDVVEDSQLGVDEVVRRFGIEVGELVSALTDNATISDYATRKREHRGRVEAAGSRAAAIYGADKLVNVRDLRALYGDLGEGAAERFKAPLDLRITLWREDLDMLERCVPQLGIGRELRSELNALDRQRRRSLDANLA